MSVVPQPDRSTTPAAVLVMPTRPSVRLATPLPRPLTSLIDREHERATLVGLLRNPSVRLLTLTGPGGVGKTRLALAAAAAVDTPSTSSELAPTDERGQVFSAGVAFVQLAPVSDPTLVEGTIARALGLQDVGAEPLADRLAQILGDARLLLLIDNFEQVVAAAPLMTDLLSACPGLTALVTSRVRLRLSGEQEFPVSPLALPPSTKRPDAGGAAQTDAVLLFVERARAVQPEFAVTPEVAPAVTEIVRRVDGLPLAVELAAARVKTLTPSALLDRLERRLPLLTGGGRDLPPRQQTMRDTIAWSQDLLTPAEQTLFRRISVFVGGFTLAAAEAVGGGQESGVGGQGEDAVSSLTPDSRLLTSTLDGIASLVEQSLLRQVAEPDAEPRYLMLETVREYGIELLEASGEEAPIRDRHAAWCLAMAQESWTTLTTTYDPSVVERLETELANLRAALVWLDRGGQGDRLLQLAAAIGQFWFLAGHFREGRDWLERALAASAAAIPARVQALSLAGLLAHFLGDVAAADDHLRQAIALAGQLGLPADEARAKISQGVVLEDREDYAAAEEHFAAALSMARQAGHDLWAVTATYHLGIVAYGRGEAARAASLWEEALAEARKRDDAIVADWCLQHLGLLAADQGDLARAADLLSECASMSQEVSHRRNRGALLATLAVLGSACGATEASARLLGAAESAEASTGGQVLAPPEGVAYQRAAARLRETLGQSAYDQAVAIGRIQGVDAIAVDVDTVLTAATSAPTLPETNQYGLTPREQDVLRLLVEGRTSPEIAEALFISTRTATTHVSNILSKLGVATRTEAATRAVRDNLI